MLIIFGSSNKKVENKGIDALRREIQELVQKENGEDRLKQIKSLLVGYPKKSLISSPQSSSLRIKRFDPAKIPNTFKALIIGKAHLGKTTLVLDLMKKKNLGSGIVVNPSESVENKYPISESLKILKEYDSNTLRSFVDDLRRKDDKSSNLLVLDGTNNDQLLSTDDSYRFIICYGQSMRCNLIQTEQYPRDLPISIRANIDYFFIFGEKDRNNRQKLCDYYCGIFPTFELFNTILDNCTQESYGCMVFDNYTISDKLEDQVYWYMADQ